MAVLAAVLHLQPSEYRALSWRERNALIRVANEIRKRR